LVLGAALPLTPYFVLIVLGLWDCQWADLPHERGRRAMRVRRSTRAVGARASPRAAQLIALRWRTAGSSAAGQLGTYYALRRQA